MDGRVASVTKAQSMGSQLEQWAAALSSLPDCRQQQRLLSDPPSIMDLTKMSGPERVQLCRKYFICKLLVDMIIRGCSNVRTFAVGTAFLPFLWFVNCFWFFKYAFRIVYETEASEKEGKEIKKWVCLSAIGSLLWIVLLISWNVYFQKNRTTLDWADSLTYILPIGRP